MRPSRAIMGAICSYKKKPRRSGARLGGGARGEKVPRRLHFIGEYVRPMSERKTPPKRASLVPPVGFNPYASSWRTPA